MVAALTIASALLLSSPAGAHATKRVPCWQSMKDGRIVLGRVAGSPNDTLLRGRRYRILRYDMMQDHNISTSGSCLITTR